MQTKTCCDASIYRRKKDRKKNVNGTMTVVIKHKVNGKNRIKDDDDD